MTIAMISVATTFRKVRTAQHFVRPCQTKRCGFKMVQTWADARKSRRGFCTYQCILGYLVAIGQFKKMGSIFACWNVSSQRGLSGINMSSRNNKLTSQRKSLVIPEPNFQECSWLTRQRGSFSWKLTRVMYEILWLPITFKQTGIGHCVSRCIRSGRCLVLDFRFIELFHYLDACRLCVFEMEGGWNWMIWIDELGSMVDGHSMRDHNKSNWTGGNWTGGRDR